MAIHSRVVSKFIEVCSGAYILKLELVPMKKVKLRFMCGCNYDQGTSLASMALPPQLAMIQCCAIQATVKEVKVKVSSVTVKISTITCIWTEHELLCRSLMQHSQQREI